MAKTQYQYIVTLKFLGEEMERIIVQTSETKAVIEFKKMMFDKDFWKNTKYTITARMKPIN